MNPTDIELFKQRLREIPSLFISGLVAVLPILITLAVVVWIIDIVEGVFGEALKLVLPDQAYARGMGLFFGLIVILVAGAATQAIVFRQAARWFERKLEHIPLINTVYGAVRDLTGLFARKDDEAQFGRPVLVNMPAFQMDLVGFVTVQDFDSLPFKPPGDAVGVYLPMSYQIGGYTVFVPRECITVMDMSFEDAMRFVVTAGMSRRVSDPPPPAPSPHSTAPVEPLSTVADGRHPRPGPQRTVP